MPCAIGLAVRRVEPAISKVSASRIAERPAAGGSANVLEAQPPHLADFGVAKAPAVLASSGEIWRSRERAASAPGSPAVERTWRGIAHSRPAGRACVLPRATPRPPPPLSLIPIRLAFPITAFREATPRAAAILLALFPSRASLLRSSIASEVHSIRMLQWLSQRRSTARNGQGTDILVRGGGRDATACPARQFSKNFQFLQHLKKTNYCAMADSE